MINRFNASNGCCLIVCLLLLICDIIDLLQSDSFINDKVQQYIIFWVLVCVSIINIVIMCCHSDNQKNYMNKINSRSLLLENDNANLPI